MFEMLIFCSESNEEIVQKSPMGGASDSTFDHCLGISCCKKEFWMLSFSDWKNTYILRLKIVG